MLPLAGGWSRALWAAENQYDLVRFVIMIRVVSVANLYHLHTPRKSSSSVVYQYLLCLTVIELYKQIGLNMICSVPNSYVLEPIVSNSYRITYPLNVLVILSLLKYFNLLQNWGFYESYFSMFSLKQQCYWLKIWLFIAYFSSRNDLISDYVIH